MDNREAKEVLDEIFLGMVFDKHYSDEQKNEMLQKIYDITEDLAADDVLHHLHKM